MASSNITAQPIPPDGHVHLVLFEQPPETFYLEIPLRVITEVCCHPPKYLQYLGWCVLGAKGALQDGQGDQVDLNGNLIDRGIYYYRTQQDILLHAVDLEVIALRAQVPSETTETRDGFRQELARRDGEQCVWTGLPCVGMHIIPWIKGEEWLQLIVENRPHGNEQRLHTLRSINDIRNGIMGTPTFHPSFDSRAAVILKTPNIILQASDVPERHIRNLPDGASYPNLLRYTLQWLADVNPFLREHFPNNSDAAFVSSRKSKPSDLLLHYNYGVAAVKNWGRNNGVLSNRPGLPRPQAPDSVPMGLTRTVGKRTTTISKLEHSRAKKGRQQPSHKRSSSRRVGSAAATNSKKPVWDEDDVVLYFWGNSPAAMQRHDEKEREREENINKWRYGIAE